MIPIYKGTVAEATERGELDQWRKSHRETQRCRDVIDQAIREHFNGWHLDRDIHLPIIEEFGIDRVNTVLASTLAHKDYDGRFSRYNREWVSGLDVTTDDRYVSEAHPAVLDGFIDMVRNYNEQSVTENAKERPSEDGEDIKQITTDDLRQMKGSEGLILQGCGGSLQEWIDGINNELTDAGILLDGTEFSDVSVFKNEDVTCLLFPFSEDVKLDIGKLAMWRLRTHEAFFGTWLSDYVPNRLGGFVGDEPDYDGKNPDYDGDPDEDDGMVMQ